MSELENKIITLLQTGTGDERVEEVSKDLVELFKRHSIMEVDDLTRNSRFPTDPTTLMLVIEKLQQM